MGLSAQKFQFAGVFSILRSKLWSLFSLQDTLICFTQPSRNISKVEYESCQGIFELPFGLYLPNLPHVCKFFLIFCTYPLLPVSVFQLFWFVVAQFTGNKWSWADDHMTSRKGSGDISRGCSTQNTPTRTPCVGCLCRQSLCLCTTNWGGCMVCSLCGQFHAVDPSVTAICIKFISWSSMIGYITTLCLKCRIAERSEKPQ